MLSLMCGIKLVNKTNKKPDSQIWKTNKPVGRGKGEG